MNPNWLVAAARKLSPQEQELASSESEWLMGEYERLVVELELARDATQLPAEPTGRAALHALLISVREANEL